MVDEPFSKTLRRVGGFCASPLAGCNRMARLRHGLEKGFFVCNLWGGIEIMKKALVLLFAVLVAAVLFAGCSGSNTPATSPTTTSPGDSPSAPASDAAAIPDFTLTVKAPDGDKQFTSSDAAKLTPVTLEATTTNKNGDSTTSTYVGVKLSDILNAVGVSDFTSLTIVASDGFSADYSNDLAMADDTILA